jgi:hypothetical protein
MNIRIFKQGQLMAEFTNLTEDCVLNLLKRHSLTPDLLPDEASALWPEGEIKTNYGSIEWTTLEEV